MSASTALLFDAFATLMEYPPSVSAEQTQKCLEALQPIPAEAASQLAKFANFYRQAAPQKMQEVYTTTFDMQPVCYPYVGFHLYGESYKRGAFMAQLNEAYRAGNYSAEQELPDHLSVILHFLGKNEENHQSEFGQALISSGAIPALEKMLATFGPNSENPYFGLLSALHLFLVHSTEREPSHA
ncbi:MAG: nitrate reductase molybdenum cofactor assembly chaperone [Anaerolineales bacterium]|nr:nitrate reductase molybdenum cofactor assembly chaperone [Anaerolineales bacterium]